MEERLTAIVGARITEFKRKMAEVNAISKKVATGMEKKVDANTKPFYRKIAEVMATAKIIDGKTLWVNIKARSDNFNRELDDLADTIRTFGTVLGNMGKGALWTMFPALSPIIASSVGAVATAGVAIGVMGGQLLGLLSGFTLAAAGAGAFAAIMIPTISNIKMARTEINEGRKAMEDYSKPMQRAIKAQDKMNSAWLYMNEAIEPQVLGTLSAGMESVSILIDKLSPGIKLVADAFEGLMESMKKAFNNAPDMQRTFAWFNERAAGAVTAWGEIAGYALRGFFNLMRAFDPLAQTMETGLLNMTKRFSEWADGLGKSEKFKKFIEYVQTNGPKLGAIFGNIIVGLVNMFAAFGPLAADMLTGFQNMTARFREWSGALSENQAFQDFVAHIRENGPKVVELIGNITDFLVQLGIAMAPIGSFLLDVANGFLSWATGMMKAHPVASNILVGLISLAGIFRMMLPLFLLFKNMFGGVFTYVWRMFVPFKGAITTGLTMLGQSVGRFAMQIVSWMPMIGAAFTKVMTGIGRFVMQVVSWLPRVGMMFLNVARVVGSSIMYFISNMAMLLGKFLMFTGRMLIQGLLWAARMVAMWFIAMGPIGWVILAVGTLVAFIIWKWDWVKAVSIKVWTAVWNWIVNVWNMIVQAVSLAAQLVVEYVKSKFNNALNTTKTVWNAVKSFISTTWNNIKSSVQSAVSNVVNKVRDGFNNAKSAVVEKMTAIWNNIKEKWESIKSTISEKVSSILSTIREKFQEIVNSVREKLQEAYNKVTEIMGEVLSYLQGIDLFDIGASIIEGLMNGIGSMAKAVIGKVTDVVGGAIDAAKELLNINSPSRVFMSLGHSTGEGFMVGMQDMARSVARTSQSMIGASIPSMAPLDVATPAGISVPTVNVPEAKSSAPGSNSKSQPIIVNLGFGKRQFGAVVEDITQLQQEIQLRERREAGN